MERISLVFRSAMYALRGGFLIRPFVIAILLGAVGAVLSSLEEAVPAIGAWVPIVLFPSREDPQVAQVILSSIATSIMTVVSIVFAILLMTLTLASTQFSPRILVSFVRDRTTQWTLGVFLGTFSYCMASLPAARSLPHPFVPVVTTSGAMVLALVSVGWLIFFIHHISQAISVNHIVDRIARETEFVIDEFMTNPRTPFRYLKCLRTIMPLTRSHCRINGPDIFATSMSAAFSNWQELTAFASASSAVSVISFRLGFRFLGFPISSALRPSDWATFLQLLTSVRRGPCNRMSSLG